MGSSDEPPSGAAAWDGEKWVVPVNPPPGSTWDSDAEAWIYPAPPVKGATWDGTRWVPKDQTWMEKNQTACCLMLILGMVLFVPAACLLVGSVGR